VIFDKKAMKAGQLLIAAVVILVVLAAGHEGHDHDHHDHHESDHHDHHHDDDHDHPHEHETMEQLEERLRTGGEKYVPGPDEEPVPPELIAELVRYCKEFRYTHHPLVNAKEEHQPEKELVRHAFELGEYLHQAKEEHVKKDHQHFSCEEAKAIVDHSAAQNFMNHYARLIDGTTDPKIPHRKVIEQMETLHKEFKESGLVNEEVLVEVEKILASLKHLEKWYPQVKRHFDAVSKAKSGDDCRPDYQKFVAELHTLSSEHVPHWGDIDRGLLHLIEQCAEDPYLKSEL